MFSGMGIFDFYLTGNVIKVDKVEDFIGKCSGKIIVLKTATPDIILLFNEVTGIICEHGGITCHLALLAREMSIPCLVGVAGISGIENGALVEICSFDGKGTVYEINPVQYA